MARQDLRFVKQAVSIDETAMNVFLDDGALFRRFMSESAQGVFPTKRYVEDNMVGDGRAAPKKSKSAGLNPLNRPVSGLLHTTSLIAIVRDALGGTIDNTNRTAQGTQDSLIHMKSPGSVPRMRNELYDLGGKKLVYPSMFVQTLEISQEGSAPPRFTATRNNTGGYKKIADTNIDTADVEERSDYLLFDGNQTRITMNIGGDSYDFGQTGRNINFTLTWNQNVLVENLIGDPYIDAGFTMTTGGAAAAAVSIPLNAPLPAGAFIPSGKVIIWSNGQAATLSADANAGDSALTVTALSGEITASATSTYQGNQCRGAYSKNAHIQVQSGTLRLKNYADENFDEFEHWEQDAEITSISIIFKTCEQIGLSNDQFELELKIPVGEFSLTPDTQGEFDATGMEIRFIDGDPVTGDLMQARVRHDVDDLIEEIL